MADDDANEIKAVEEVSLANCWTAPLCSVYSCYSKVTASFSTKMHISSVSSVVNTNSLQPKMQEESTFWEKALELMDEWDKAAKDREHKHKEAELEISRTLDELTKAINKATIESSLLFQSSLPDDIKQLFDQTSVLDQKYTELEERHTNFDADWKKRFRDHNKKLAKKLDAQTQSFNTKIN
eukprot:13047358-Ditylum_brightwellii.AAC.2